MQDKFNADLAAVLARRLPGFVALLECRRLTAGASQETYAVTVKEDNGRQQRYALRRATGARQPDEPLALTLDAEAELVAALHAAAVAVPKLILKLQPGDQLGHGFLMQWLEGETLGHRISTAPALATMRQTLAYECGETLAQIHAIDWRQGQLDKLLPTLTTRELVQDNWDYYRSLNVPLPMIDYSARWLLENLPSDVPPALVHADFRNGNLMVDATGIKAVLDWELAHLGDPMRDLGWICVNSWRFGNPDLPVGGFGERSDLLMGYATVSGREVDPQQLHFWEAFGSFYWAVMCLRMAASFRHGNNPSVERPAIGRRSSEAQMDCVNLLIPGDYTLPTACQPPRDQLPVVDELLDGVSRFLQSQSGESTGSTRYLGKVAVNNLSIVRRELGSGPLLLAAETTRLQALLATTGSTTTLRRLLCERLRSGMALATQGLAAHLRQSAADQLWIDQPGYSALRPLQES